MNAQTRNTSPGEASERAMPADRRGAARAEDAARGREGAPEGGRAQEARIGRVGAVAREHVREARVVALRHPEAVRDVEDVEALDDRLEAEGARDGEAAGEAQGGGAGGAAG